MTTQFFMFNTNKNYLQHKKVWLIGASYGIGEELAKLLSKECKQLVISARSENKLSKLAKSIGATAEPLDVQNETDAAHIFNKHNGFDIIIYNAGVYTPAGDTTKYDLEDAIKTIDVNLTGAFKCLDTPLDNFLNNGIFKHVVIVGSIAGYTGLEARAYGASKAALINFTEGLKGAYGKKGLKVQLVSPGFVKTRLTDKNNFKMPMRISAEQAAKKILKGMKSNRFEIRFPFLFGQIIRLIRLLPYWLYFTLFSKK